MSQSLKVGLLLSAEHGAEDDIAQRFQNVLDIARCAQQTGFDFLDAPQHLLAAPNQYLHCIPMLSRVAAEVPGMRLGTNIIQLTLHHPVEIAEQLATLDVITGGNLCVGFGRGYREEEFLSFGVTPGTRLSRFLEALDVVKRLWTEDSVTYEGKHFKLDGVSIGIRPLQKPRPPIILAASADAMVVRTAKIADGLTMAGHSTLANLTHQMDLYKAALADEGKSFPPPINRLVLETYVAKDMETARKEAFPHIARKYASYANWGQDDMLPPGETFSAPIEALAEDRFIVGDPDHVAERLIAYRDALGLTEIGVRMHWLGMPYEQYEGSVRLFAESVIPRLKS